MRSSPRLERAQQELAEIEDELTKTQRGLGDLAAERRKIISEFQRADGRIAVAAAALTRQAQEQKLKRDLLSQELTQIRAKESLLLLTWRRWTSTQDARARGDALAMARELGIREADLPRYV